MTVDVYGSGRAGLACATILARAGYAVRVHDSDAGAYDSYEAFDASATGALRTLGVDPFAACGARAVRGFNGSEYVVARRGRVRDALLDVARGAGVAIGRTHVDANANAWVVDATGRSALRTPVERETAAVAYLFDGPPATALTMLRAPFGWGYRIGDERGSTVGVIAARPFATEAAARAWAHSAFGVALSAAPATRRAASVQRCARPIDGRTLAVGDAAFAPDPMTGQGQSFALTSAALAAATIRTCVERPARDALARAFYTDAVTRAARVDARDHASGGARAVDLDASYVFAGEVRSGAVLHDGLIDEVPVVAWDGRQGRWSAGVDLLDVAAACPSASAGWHVIDRLARRGIEPDRAVAVVSRAIARGLLRPAS